MKKTLSLLKIHPGEGSKVLRFALLGAALQAGLAIGISCADSLFLTQVGPDKLPFIYMMTPVIMLGCVPIFAYLMGRLGIDRLFDITLGILIAGGITLYLALTPSGLGLYGPSGPPQAVFYIAKLYTALWYIALYTMLWNFVDCYFHILDAKRLFSFLSGGMAFGAMIGGALVSTLVPVIGVQELFLVWSASAFCVFLVLLNLRRNCRKITEEESRIDQETLTFREQAARIWQVIRTSRYSNYMILTFLCTLTITTLCEFQYMQIFETGRTDAEIAELFGKLYFWVNAFNLVVNIFIFNRLVAVIGVRNTALIQPVVYALAFSFLLLQNGFSAAVAAFFAYQGILTSIEYNNQNFLFNALPSREKAQVRTFVEGLCEPLATAAAGIFLLLYASRVSPQMISAIGLAGAALALCSVLGLRSHYLPAMVENLKKAWLRFSRTAPGSLSSLDQANLEILRIIAESKDRKRALAAISIYWMNDKYTAVELLLSYLKCSQHSDQKAAGKLFSAVLEDGDNRIFRRLLEWMEEGRRLLDASLLEICGRHNLLSREDIRILSEHGNIDRRTAAAVARWQSWELSDALKTLQLADQYSGGPLEEQVAALHIIGASGEDRYVHFLAKYLSNKAPAIRMEALKSLTRIANPSSSPVIPDILSAIASADRETRLVGLEALRVIGDPSCVRPLISFSPDFPPCDRRNVEDVILDIGLPAVPVLASILRDNSVPHTHKSIAARALGALSFPQFEILAPDLIHSAISTAYRYMTSFWNLSTAKAPEGAFEFMTAFYKDAQLSSVDFVLELLTISGQLPDFEMLASSLRSDNAKERGDAIETIEQGCSRDIFRLLLPLVDASPLESKMAFYHKAYGASMPSVKDTVFSSTESPVPLESAGAIHAAWRLRQSPGAPFSQSQTLAIMKDRLLNRPSPIIEDVVFSLLKEHDTHDGITAEPGLNPIEILTCLMHADFFSKLNALEMVHILPGISLIETSDTTIFRKGEPSDSVYVVLDGAVTIPGQTDRIIDKMKLAGSEAISGAGEYLSDAHTRNAVLLKVPAANITAAAEIFPQAAINVYARRIGLVREQISPL